MSSKKRFLCIGSISFDLIFQVERMPAAHEKLRCPTVHQSCGGSAANTAWWLARLGHDVTFAGCVGNDTFGARCLEQLSTAGINVEQMQRVDDSTGIATVFTNPNDKRMVTSAGANRHFDPEQVDFTDISSGDVVHLSVGDDTKALYLMQQATDRGAFLSCEFNGNRNPEQFRFSDQSFMNRDELRRWMNSDDPIGTWQQTFPEARGGLAVTLGQEGAAYVTAADVVYAPAIKTDVMDRTGGGDAFDAGFLHAIAIGSNSVNALRTGLALASETVGRIGAMPSDVTDEILAGLPQPAIA